MSNRFFQSWNARIAAIIQYSGTDDFFNMLIDSLRHYVKIEYPQIWLFEGNKPPSLLYHDYKFDEIGLHIDEYISAQYKLDPFYLASTADIGQGVYNMQNLADQDYHNSQYLDHYYSKLEVSDEISQIIKLTPSKVLNISLMRSHKTTEFNLTDQKFLFSAEPLIRALIQQHWKIYAGIDHQKPAFNIPLETTDKMNNTIQNAIQKFGSSILTAREQQVVDLSLRGHTIKTSAEKLNISADTLKKHRKHIYKKLDISSNSELYAIFIQSLPGYAASPEQDPYEIFTAHYL